MDVSLYGLRHHVLTARGSFDRNFGLLVQGGQEELAAGSCRGEEDFAYSTDHPHLVDLSKPCIPYHNQLHDALCRHCQPDSPSLGATWCTDSFLCDHV